MGGYGHGYSVLVYKCKMMYYTCMLPPHKVTRRIATGAGIPPAIRKPSNPQSPGGLGLPLNSPDIYIYMYIYINRDAY